MDGRPYSAPLLLMPEEVEFFAEEVKIKIVPNFKFDPEELRISPIFQGSLTKLRPNVQAEVPLWLALALHKRHKCRILLPEWMDREALNLTFESEKSDNSQFQAIPDYYIEIYKLLLGSSREAVEADFDMVKDGIEGIRQTRMHKIQAGLRQVSDSVTLKLNNLAAGECNLMRGFMTQALDMFQKLSESRTGTAVHEEVNASLEI